jgi:hypothetical protein
LIGDRNAGSPSDGIDPRRRAPKARGRLRATPGEKTEEDAMPRQDCTTPDDTDIVALTHDFSLEAQAEFEAICDKVCVRLREGSLPPDEAYWWTRILFQEAVARLAVLSMITRRIPYDVRDRYPSGAHAA